MNKNIGEGNRLGVKEIARLAKVSIATVDRVIHNRSGVSDSTRKKIQKIIKDVNYQPNILASRLASRKVFNIAVIIPAVSEETDYWQAPLDGIQRAAAEISEYGIRISYYCYDLNSKQSFRAEAGRILEHAAETDAVLIAPAFNAEAVAFLHECREHDWPYVFINSDIPEQDSLCYIGPDLRQSGYLAAHLMRYAMPSDARLLVVNISREIDDHHHLLRKEEGFRSYFATQQAADTILKLDIHQTDYPSVKARLEGILDAYPDIRGVFTTNSRVSSVARFLEGRGKQGMQLIGYDFLGENIEHLKRNNIDFLICQKPEEQGYRGIMALYRHLVLSATVEKTHYMPIDIITRENYQFYSN
jgi:LacI family transcriptional regulator